jgi:hypothetical protein
VSALDYPLVDNFGLDTVIRRAYNICGKYFYFLFIKQDDMFTLTDIRTSSLDIIGYKGGERLK